MALLSTAKISGSLNESLTKTLNGLNIRFQSTQRSLASQLRALLQRYRGDKQVYVHVPGPEKTAVIALGRNYYVQDNSALRHELESLLGAEALL